MKRDRIYKVSVVQQTSRSLEYHQKYFGGLLELAQQYWSPEAGSMSLSESYVLDRFCAFAANGNEETYASLMEINTVFSSRLKLKRAEQYDRPMKKGNEIKQDIHDWIKEEIGFYEQVLTPTGWKKRLKSINFNAMRTDEEFDAFYKKAFDAVWNYVLSRHMSQEEAENVILQLISLGSYKNG